MLCPCTVPCTLLCLLSGSCSFPQDTLTSSGVVSRTGCAALRNGFWWLEDLLLFLLLLFLLPLLLLFLLHLLLLPLCQLALQSSNPLCTAALTVTLAFA